MLGALFGSFAPARMPVLPVFSYPGTNASMKLNADSTSAASTHCPSPVFSRDSTAMTVPNAAYSAVM